MFLFTQRGAAYSSEQKMPQRFIVVWLDISTFALLACAVVWGRVLKLLQFLIKIRQKALLLEAPCVYSFCKSEKQSLQALLDCVRSLKVASGYLDAPVFPQTSFGAFSFCSCFTSLSFGLVEIVAVSTDYLLSP